MTKLPFWPCLIYKLAIDGNLHYWSVLRFSEGITLLGKNGKFFKRILIILYYYILLQYMNIYVYMAIRWQLMIFLK
jgi:hypothetical protein